ncbi:uncharacterized protein LOC142764834 [Rhipicephalus microplus]|uniref:uncharacterized protein LOC142764834 n=1 Tax=Rhipicephalus microplus TaxID=6941 RepID=UPI003F6C65C2
MTAAAFSRPAILVALPLQMGVVFYRFQTPPNHVQAALFSVCNEFGLTDYSQACQVTQTDLTLEKTAIGLSSEDQEHRFGHYFLFAFDTLTHMKDKATVLMERPGTRINMTWLLMNVDLTDSTRGCLTGGPFERLMAFRDFYYRQAQKPKG